MSAALRRTLIILLSLAGALLVSTFPVSAAPSGTVDDEAGFVRHTNGDRVAAGLPALSVSGDLTAVARRHAQRMADAGEHYHNSNLADEVASGWRMLGENVGQGPSVDGLHRAFMESPSHRANILRSEFSQVGIGVVRDAGGGIFVVEVFRQPGATAAPAAAPAPAPKPAAAPEPALAPAPAPPVATPPTTVPPAPSTTVPVPAPAPSKTGARPIGETNDTLRAAAALSSYPVVASVEPVDAARSVAGPATIAAVLIAVLFAAHAGTLRRRAAAR